MISPTFKCVFVHIPKCAGQSVEHLFLEAEGLTWENRHRLLLRYNDDPAAGPPRLAHLTASDYVTKGYLTAEEFDAFTSFTVVRNPYSRAVSFYKYLGYSSKMDFERFATRVLPGRLWKKKYWFVRPQIDYIVGLDGEHVVEHLLRLESLDVDFERISETLGLPTNRLPHVNQSKAGRERETVRTFKGQLRRLRDVLQQRPVPSFASYRDYYSAASKQAILALYIEDFKQLGYRTDDV